MLKFDFASMLKSCVNLGKNLKIYLLKILRIKGLNNLKLLKYKV